MTQPVKKYKILLEQQTIDKDKNVVINLGDAFQFHDQKDLIDLRSEIYMDHVFENENPTIDFEKYKFKPETILSGISFYFYQRALSDSTPMSYDDTNPPIWAISGTTYDMSSGFNVVDVPKSVGFLDSYFKFEFLSNPITQKSLFSVTLPLDGTMLTGLSSIPIITFHQTIKTELEYIYWLRKPQQLPGINFSGGTFDLYCLVSFYNSKTRKVINFKWKPELPNDNTLLNNYTIQDRYLLYRLNYNDFTYQILNATGGTFNNQIKLYAL